MRFGGTSMELEVKRALFLHVNKRLTENQLFNSLVDIANNHDVAVVMDRVPPEYLARFRNWIHHLPSLDTLIHVKSGPISIKEKNTLEAIRVWLDRHSAERDSKVETLRPTRDRSHARSDRIIRHAGVPAPRGLIWDRTLTSAPAFTYFWPKNGGGKAAEEFGRNWQGFIAIRGKEMKVRIGECTRHKRPGLTVFFDSTPIIEFIETSDGNGWASVIRPDGRRALKVSETPPPFYFKARVERYRDISGLSGRGVPNALAVVVGKDDLPSVVHHAAARWLAKNRYPVEPAA
jgi:hypothetical protein